jgi:molybdate transport system regulatory protein
MRALSLRIDLEANGRIGPGKVELLEQIATHGSIAAGARRMGMSYRQAWTLVEELNRLFGKPAVQARKGGQRGGGAELTPLGLAIVARYRAIERAAEAAAEPHIAALRSEIAGE